MKLALLIVVGSIGVLNVALMLLLIGTLVARLAGLVSVMVGPAAFKVVPVVKLHGFGTTPATNALPARSLAALEIVAVYCVLAVRFAVGVKTIVRLAVSYVTVPGTATAPAVTTRVTVPATPSFWVRR